MRSSPALQAAQSLTQLGCPLQCAKANYRLTRRPRAGAKRTTSAVRTSAPSLNGGTPPWRHRPNECAPTGNGHAAEFGNSPSARARTISGRLWSTATKAPQASTRTVDP